MPDEISGFHSHHGFLIGAAILWVTLCLVGREIIKSIDNLRAFETKEVLLRGPPRILVAKRF
jgi:hypothetical protein